LKNYTKANKGLDFEAEIEAANQFYFDRGIAAIIKIPTSFKIQRRYNPLKKISEIIGAFPEKKSTVDFVGQYYNDPVWFEAKSTSNKTSFPLKNIEDHQLCWLEAVEMLHAKAFILIECKELKSIYRITSKQLRHFMATEKRKSIPFSYFEKHCHKVTLNNLFIIDYLKDI
jgi:recombination protein U